MNRFTLLLIWKRSYLFSIILLLLTACTASNGQTNTDSVSVQVPELESEVPTPPFTNNDPSTRIPEDKYDDLTIVTLLPRDAIPAIDDPQFLTVGEADSFYEPQELIIGVEFNGDTRAYSIPLLSRHEIVNDTVGGVKIAVTW